MIDDGLLLAFLKWIIILSQPLCPIMSKPQAPLLCLSSCRYIPTTLSKPQAPVVLSQPLCPSPKLLLFCPNHFVQAPSSCCFVPTTLSKPQAPALCPNHFVQTTGCFVPTTLSKPQAPVTLSHPLCPSHRLQRFVPTALSKPQAPVTLSQPRFHCHCVWSTASVG